MKKYFLFLFFLFSFLNARAQESSSKITLKSGAEFVGVIILKNDELIMLRDNAGARFQFALTEVDKIETAAKTLSDSTSAIPSEIEGATANQFCGQLELSIGNALARKAFDFASITQAELSFGNRKAFGKDLFVGVGAGYIWLADADLGLVPATLKIQMYTSKNRTSPFLGFESGYAFSTTKNTSGGAFAKISAGVNHRLNYKLAIYAGISAAVYGISSKLTETTQSGNYNFDGSTTINALTLKAGFQF